MMPNLVVVDGRLLHRPVSGLERYVSSLTTALGNRGEGSDLALTVEWPVRVAPELARQCKVIPVHNERHLVETIKAGPECLYHLTWLGYSAAHYLPLAVASAGVLTIPDFILWDHPEYSTPELHNRFHAALRGCLGWAHRVLVYSEHTRGQAIERLNLPPGSVGVVPLAADERFGVTCDDGVLEAVRRGIGGRYILSVGKDYPHKNLDRLIEGFARSGLKDHKLAIIGEPVWPGGRQQLVAVARRRRVEDRVVFLDHMLDQELPSLYQASDAFVFPSLEEGFGLPPLEAMASGVPVVCSKAASLPEVVGDAAVMVDASNVEAIASGIRTVLEDSILRASLVRRGKERSCQLTWASSAERTFDNYRIAIATPAVPDSPPRAGGFLRYFPADLSLIDRVLGSSPEHPRTQCLMWVAGNVSEKSSNPQPIAKLRQDAVDAWLRARLDAIPSMDLVLAEDLSDNLDLTKAIEFAAPSRVIVVGDHDNPVRKRRMKSIQFDNWPLHELLARLKLELGLRSDNANVQLLRDVAAVELPERFSQSLGLALPVMGAFSIDLDRPLPDPDKWIEVISEIGLRTCDGYVLVGDSRVTFDPDWIALFRKELRSVSPRHPMWLGTPGRIRSILDDLGEQDSEEWIICPLEGLDERDSQALRERGPLRLAVTVILASTRDAGDEFEQLVARAWTVGADAALVEIANTDGGDLLVQAASEEIKAAVVASRNDSVFAHALRLRRELLESRRRERDVYESALRSHLDGVRSYQEQLDRFVTQAESLDRSIATAVSRLASR